MKIKTLSVKITPEPGVLLAGYGLNVKSVGVHDDLFVKIMALDDGVKRILLLVFDLLGMDQETIGELRKLIQSVYKLEPNEIIVSCTHTHSGPHTRKRAGLLNSRYLDTIFTQITDELKNNDIFSAMTECDVYHYSTYCDENVNRRIIHPDNRCSYLPDHKELLPLARGITDPELGLLYFVDRGSEKPALTLVNYAAHPITGQSDGLSSLLISADYPGVLRRAVEANLGGECIFGTGACGDLVTKGHECGFDQVEYIGKKIAKQIITSFSDAKRSPDLYKLESASLKTAGTELEVALRQLPEGYSQAEFTERTSVMLELNFFSIGDIAFVVSPDEMLCEPGLTLKWFSPFRKTFILYNATHFISYMAHDNAYTAGGYEAETSYLQVGETFRIVNAFNKLLNENH